MKTIIQTFAVLAIVLLGIALFATSHEAMAQASEVQDGVNSIGGTGSSGNLMTGVRRLTDVFLFLIGAVSVIMIIFGGFKYVTSSGESSAVSSAKNTILYAVVGLVIALSAYVIADFVIDAFQMSPGEAGNQAGNAARDAADNAIDTSTQSDTPNNATQRNGVINQ